MFRSATFRLSISYLAIIMLISVVFSVAIYQTSDRELRTSLRRQAVAFRQMPWYQDLPPDLADLPERQLVAAERRLGFNLILLNLVILGAAGGAAFWLARRTLRPIEAALEAQSRFTADASHELRTPLTAMKSEIEVALRDRQLSTVDARTLLASNLEEINKLEALSDGLLKLARTNEQGLQPEPVGTEPIMAAAVSRLEKVLEQHDITIDNSVRPISLMGDQASLVEAMVILLDNAIKYSSPGATIVLASGSRGQRGYLSVKDAGVGIKASDLSHIFERFYRADSSRSKERTQGYGLGLSIAQKMVLAQHGAIEVRSTVGKGSTFVVWLPLVHPSA